MTLIVFLLILSFLVLIHEAGHFISAKWFKVRTDEFGIGYPPRAKHLFNRWGTEFSLNWLPFGGFVRLAGEDRALDDEGVSDDPGLFYNKAWWKRLIIILSGAVVNFAFGVAAFAVMFSILGIPQTTGVMVTDVVEGAPAMEAGIESGDEIVAVENQAGERVEVDSTEEFVTELRGQAGEKVTLTTQKEGTTKTHEVYVRRPEEVPSGEGAIGVGIQASQVEFVKFSWWEMPFRGAAYGLETAFGFSWMVLGIFKDMFANLLFRAEVPEQIAGPIGIVYQAQKERILDEGWVGLLNWSAVLSIQLAIINVLPIPAMDGGRAVFILIEKAMGKRYKSSIERKAIIVGMAMLLLLITLVSIKDIGFVLGDLGIW